MAAENCIVRTEPASAPSASNVRTTRSGFLFRTGSDPLVRTNQPIGSPSSLMSTPRRQRDLSSIFAAISQQASLSVVKPAETTPDKSSVHISTQQDVSSPVAEQPSIPVSNTNLLPAVSLPPFPPPPIPAPQLNTTQRV